MNVSFSSIDISCFDFYCFLFASPSVPHSVHESVAGSTFTSAIAPPVAPSLAPFSLAIYKIKKPNLNLTS